MARRSTTLAILLGAAIGLVALPSHAEGPALSISQGRLPIAVGLSSVAEHALQRRHIDVSRDSRSMWDREPTAPLAQHRSSQKGYGVGVTLRCTLDL